MKYILLLLGLFLFVDLRAQDLDQLRYDVAYLSSDLLEGRETGTKGEALAAAYVASRFDEIGLRPGGDDESWFQPFELRVSANPHATNGEGELRTGRNVVGLIDNGAENTVVIGAHYDHLGHGMFGSRQPGETAIHNGADDNASGVAGLLEIAKRLVRSEAKSNNYLFVAFSGEELGLIGSKHFVANLPAEKLNYMINLDMVGRLKPERTLAANGTGTSPEWKPVLDAVSGPLGLKLQHHQSGLGPSDHTSFYLADVPVLHFFSGQHPEYHKASDDSHLINYEGLADVVSLVVGIVEAVDGKGKLPFAKTRDEQEQTRAAFKVTLGIMPDYVSTGDGVRIDAVMDGRPAAAAGLQKGDVIVRLGRLEVKTVEDYMHALSRFEKGDVTTVAVRRGEEVLEREVRF